MPDLLDEKIFALSENENWTIRHAVEGLQIFGGIGSGKTSGSGAKIARKYLEKGFGGLVLTVKVDEKDIWIKYCEETGRKKDLVIIEPGSGNCFNFLQYESARKDGGGGITSNIAKVFKTVINAEKTISHSKSSNDPFWEDALDMFLFNVIDLCRLAYDDVTFDDIYSISTSIPDTPDKLKDSEFVKSSKFAAALVKKVVAKKNSGQLSESDFYLYKNVENYFLNRHIPLSEKTRSIIEYSLEGLLFQLSREPFYSLFCKGESTVIPENCLDGKIILLNLPVKVFDKVGRDVQIMFKYIWQRAMERRVISDISKPVFLWADEAQNFIHEHDIDYQATARSARVCTVYITQNMPNYFAHMGGQSGMYHVKSFLGTLGTKIFHANSDNDTNNYASELIGQRYIEIDTENITLGKDYSKSIHPQLQKEFYVPPESFINLKTGSEENVFLTEAIVHLHRRRQIAGQRTIPYFKLSFKQQ